MTLIDGLISCIVLVPNDPWVVAHVVGIVIAQVVGWAKPDPTTKWRQLRDTILNVTLI
jgi:hypothetical protein